MPSPTSRSLALLEKEGYTSAIVEKWNPWAKIRQDLFGGIDIVALNPDCPGVLGVQTTSRGNISARVRKLQANPKMQLWLKCGNELAVHGWGKVGRGKRKTWECKIVWLTL